MVLNEKEIHAQAVFWAFLFTESPAVSSRRRTEGWKPRVAKDVTLKATGSQHG
jgi:hypothetical protein